MGPALDPVVVVTALAAGLVSFLSPCVLPLVPAYLGFITGRSADQLRHAHGADRFTVITQALAFVLGLATIFALLGASASLLGRTLLLNLPVLWKVGGVVVIVLGLHTVGIIRVPLLYRTARVADIQPSGRSGHLGALLIGLAFGAGWTPCVGPFLAGLLALASGQETVGQGTLLLLVYALGLGIPFVLAGVAVDRSLRVMRSIRPHLVTLERASGVVLVGMGLLLFTERLTLVTSWLTRLLGTGLAL